MRLGLQVLQEQVTGRLDADERQMLAVAVKNTFRLESLVDDIMDYSKLLGGKMNLEKRSCGASELIEEAAEGFAAMAATRRVHLMKEVCGYLPRVSADGRRVVQVLTNLISNALKFTPAQGMVTVSVKRGVRENAGTLVFSVTDTGRGVPADSIEAIFELFQSSGTVRQTEGTGLGLTLARMMIKLHGGRIWAEGGRALGASLCFTIPIAPEDFVEEAVGPAAPFDFVGFLGGASRSCNAFLALFV